MIIASKNPSLFPELNIPRTTALYWIREGCKETEVCSTCEISTSVHEKEIFKLRAINLLFMELLKSVNPYADFRSNGDPSVRKTVVNLVESLGGLISKKEFLSSLGISSSRYFRWRSEVLGCDIYNIKCNSGSISQLTIHEQKTLVALAQNPKLRQLSTKSLMNYAQRKKILDCSLGTWYKYLKIYKIQRKIGNERKRKKYLKGIRARRVNEIWHIDITEVKMINRQKYYLQLIVDNYSRAILSWEISKKKDIGLTLKSLKSFDGEFELPEFLMSDGGKENCNTKVKKLLIGKGVTQLIAKSDVHFSNSMIEVVFRQMKQKYLPQNFETIKELKESIATFVSYYNNKHPHSSLQGGTPKEVYTYRWDEVKFKQEIRERRISRLRTRVTEKEKCHNCFSTCKNAN